VSRMTGHGTKRPVDAAMHQTAITPTSAVRFKKLNDYFEPKLDLVLRCREFSWM
jgi:hypothetical protein